MAALHLKKRSGFLTRRRKTKITPSEMTCACLLNLALLEELPENMKPLLTYEQEAACHARWVTTASGYVCLLIFNVGQLDDQQKSKLIGLISYIVSVYVPSFLLIHLKPCAAKGPEITLFQHNLLFACREIDSELADLALKYFYEQAIQWLTPINIALGVFAEVPPYPIDAVKTGQFPDTVDVRKLLKEQKTGL